MKRGRAVVIFVFAWLLSGAAAKVPNLYNWRGIQAHKSSAEDAKKFLGAPAQQYREKLLYENQVFDASTADGQQVKLSTVVLNIGAEGIVESIFMSPEWGTTDQDVRRFFGNGTRMTYRKFLATLGDVKIGAGTRPDEKLHYVDLDSPCEYFAELRVLLLYHRQDVVSGHYLLQFILLF